MVAVSSRGGCPGLSLLRRWAGCWGLLAVLLPLCCAGAAEPGAVEGPIELADDPFDISDPVAAAPGSAEMAVIGVYERARQGRVRGTFGGETELEFGVAPRLELRIGQSGAYGNLETRRRLGAVSDLTDAPVVREEAKAGGTTRIGAMVQFTGEQGAVPALALLGRVRTLYGPGRTAYEAEGVLLAGKTIVGGERPLGVHLNLGWTTRLDPQPGDRTNRYLLNASLGQAVTQDTALVVTYARSQQERGDRDYSLLQAGLRHRLPGSGVVLGLAAGAGLSRDSPRFQLAFAVQWALGGGR